MQRVVDVRCPGCGASWTTHQHECIYCGRQVVITSMSGLRDLAPPDVRKHLQTYKALGEAGEAEPSIHASSGMCFLRLSLHDQALDSFSAAMQEQIDNPEVYFLAGAATLRGKKAFSNPLARIRSAESLVEAAIALEDRGLFFYFLAYIGFDFYERKSLNTETVWTEHFTKAWDQGVTHADVDFLFEILGVSNPLPAGP